MMADDQLKKQYSRFQSKRGKETGTSWQGMTSAVYGASHRMSKSAYHEKDILEADKTVEDTAPFDSGYSCVSSTSSRLSDFDSVGSISLSRSGMDLKPDDNMTSDSAAKMSHSKLVISEASLDSGLGIDCLSSDLSHKLSIEEKIRPTSSSQISNVMQPKVWRNIALLPSSWTVAFEPDQDGDTMLHLAIIQAETDIVMALIQLAPRPEYLDIANNLCQTPLHLAVLMGQDSIVRRLVVAGATLDLRDRNGNTALHLACQHGHLSCAQALITPVKGAEITEANSAYVLDRMYSVDLLELRNYEGKSCVHVATCCEQKKILEYLVHMGADVNALEGKSGRTALHYAVEKQKLDLVDFLITRCHADINTKNYSGLTPLHVAWKLYERSLSSRLSALVNLLKEHGGEPSERPEDSDSDSDSDLSSEEEEDRLIDIKLGGHPL